MSTYRPVDTFHPYQRTVSPEIPHGSTDRAKRAQKSKMKFCQVCGKAYRWASNGKHVCGVNR